MASKKTSPEQEVKVSKKTTVKKSAPVTEEAVMEKVMPKKETKQATISIDVVDTKGKADGTVAVPGEMFAADVNTVLMAQAVRVYLANQRQGTSRTKSRGEVQGSTRKIYRQKGTGRARHGGIRAPLFVGGGIAHGPKPRDFSMSLPKKMRKQALFSALTNKLQEKQLKVVSGFEKLPAKTKDMASAIQALGLLEKKQSILVVTNNTESVVRAARNIENVSLLPASQINTYAVLSATTVVVMKDALKTMEESFLGK